ncbi:glycosyltransferase family 4 protein [Clostridium perfringens]
MKIVHIHQYYNDGLGYQENILPRYQAELGHDVILITSNLSNGFNNDKRVKELGEYIDSNFKVRRINIKGEFKGRFVVFRNLYKELEQIKPDYIFHHSVTAPSLGVVCKYKKNNPEVFLATDNHADLNISARNKCWKFIYYNTIWKNYIKKYDKYINVYFGVTPSRCLFLNEELGIDYSKIRLLPIGADTNNIKVSITRDELCNKYNINSKNLIIVHGGKITPEKQVDRIIKALSYVKEQNITFVLFGKIDDENVKKLIKEDKRIVTLGWLDRVETLAILKHSDIGIWNTQHTTLLEDAISVGLPLILRYYGSTSHLVDNSGIFLYDGSIREIYDKLSFLVNNRQVIEGLRENSKKMSEIISYSNIANESLKYYKTQDKSGIYDKYMSKVYSDVEYKFFRRINRE